MNIESLRYFYDVVEFKSISKVAKNSHISQPALSHQLFKLEREFNGKLLERSNKGVEITQKGEVVYQYAKKILELYDLLHKEVNNEGIDKNRLDITNTSIYSNSIFLAIAGQFGSIFNNYNVNMNMEFINGEGLLINKKSDIIIGNEKLEDKNIKSEYVGSDKLVLISRKNMTKEELKESKIGLLDDKFTKEIEKKLKAEKVEVGLKSNSLSTILAFLESDNTYALVPYSDVRERVLKGELIVQNFGEYEIEYNLYISYRKDIDDKLRAKIRLLKEKLFKILK
ncbi:LysR family transcriptional regulator [Clostridium thermobutyricum]|uniref:HTH-type transcriptional regulator CynR n=1 Tax=Clostridium thermobutyricum DSM 4928 TaxID=1121339 RepID=A0A1V4STK0_9CLOT|nr:LysR family transcriptional regulator [Clostridium thermobutyricum]OPX46557.1 HTH-type transcriptional regulator CynR [Clostridium thermobutyricum DSM 4928]